MTYNPQHRISYLKSELESTVKMLKKHANEGTLTLQMEQDAINKYEHDPVALTLICDAVFPDDIMIDPNYDPSPVYFDLESGTWTRTTGS